MAWVSHGRFSTATGPQSDWETGGFAKIRLDPLPSRVDLIDLPTFLQAFEPGVNISHMDNLKRPLFICYWALKC